MPIATARSSHFFLRWSPMSPLGRHLRVQGIQVGNSDPPWSRSPSAPSRRSGPARAGAAMVGGSGERN